MDTSENNALAPLPLLVLALIAIVAKQAFGIWSPLLYLFLAVAFLYCAVRGIVSVFANRG